MSEYETEEAEGCRCGSHILCNRCNEPISLNGHGKTKIAAGQNHECMECYKDNE